jgi:hypothetical protein
MPGKKSTDDDDDNTTSNNTIERKKNQQEEEGAVKDSYACYNKLELLLQLLFPSSSSFLPPTPPNLHKFSSQNSEPNQAHFGNVTKILRHKQNRVSSLLLPQSTRVVLLGCFEMVLAQSTKIRSHQNATKKKN